MTLLWATWLNWPVTLPDSGQGYWGCWPGSLIRGIAGVCATG
ncbi:MAG TPA: hypothetical protein VMH35_26310 [Streptosporangiaceae bacterium]|nr:hypothetical protein [Streptosporangiaceae bacterium]